MLKRRTVTEAPVLGTSMPPQSQRGATIVEFALIATVFLLLVFGVIDFGRLFQSWVTIQYAAREGARYAITGRTDCAVAGDDRVACIVNQAKAATTGLYGAPGNITVKIRSWSYPNYANPAQEGSPGNACDEIEVEVDYDHHLMTPIISSIVSHVPLVGRERVLIEPYGPCGGT
ncbi:MAG: TadE/TadG family type IV pilus assembly protein [Dehalococcoidia bacterium]|jgi:Flp pilus assembly pilin Flp